MFRNVDVSCAHCGNFTSAVSNEEAIPEVPATYEASAAESHRVDPHHKAKLLLASIKNYKEKNGKGLEKNDITGRLLDFEHGKEHNA